MKIIKRLLMYALFVATAFLTNAQDPGSYSITAVATDNAGTSTTSTAKSITVTTDTTTDPLAKCKGKYLGNIIEKSAGINYNNYWNQATSENGSKWGSIENTRGTYNWTASDVAYNWAKNNGGLFKYHCFVWAYQTPPWVASASVEIIQEAIQNYIKACSTHYTPMGGLKMIDVLNEPVNSTISAKYKAALTAGYKAESANAGDLDNPYGWAIWPFQLARKYFPDAVLLINEYNTEMNWNSCRAPYLAMASAIKNAPNLTDGQKNIIDGVGLQCHGIETLTAANFKSYLDDIWTTTGLPAHITQFDAKADPDEAKQQSVYSTLIPVAWEHPHVAGIALLGYIQGTTWINGNGVKGPGGTDTGIMYADGSPRPALTWLMTYMASQATLSCCPAPAPSASCTVVTDVEDQVETKDGAVYPNPFHEELHLLQAGDFSYQLMNSSGQLQKIGKGHDELRIGQNLPKGFYLLKVSQNGLSKLFKIVKE